MIKEWLQEYNPQNQQDASAALREIMQEIALAGLHRAGFFEKAAFYGGTALRIFYGLDRFSEDLDFSLLEKETDFSLEPYFDGLITEFKAVGMTVSIKEKKKTTLSSVESAFLKQETLWRELILEDVIKQNGVNISPNIKIKIEVDRVPPLGFETEEKLLLRPYSFYVKCFRLPDLFAGKMHALLFRKWQNRVKGRDWYDLEWYIKKGTPLNINHFLMRAIDSGHRQEEEMTKEQFLEILHQKIDTVSFDSIKEDAARFISDGSVINIWNKQYFTDLVKHLKFN